MTQTPFSALMGAMQGTPGAYEIELPADWLQGRTAYGGLSAAICLEAACRSEPNLPPLRSAQYCFVGPATGPLRIAVQVLRRGKSTVLLSAELHGEAGLAVRATLCFGSGRQSAVHHDGMAMPAVAAPEACPDYYTWEPRPNFMRHFVGKLASGARPGTPGVAPAMTVWLRHHDNEAHPSAVGLLALADALPPAAMVCFSEVIPISTMTWSIEVLSDAPTSPSGWWLLSAKADTSMNGYSAQETIVWSAEGQPVIVARQNVAIFG